MREKELLETLERLETEKALKDKVLATAKRRGADPLDTAISLLLLAMKKARKG